VSFCGLVWAQFTDKGLFSVCFNFIYVVCNGIHGFLGTDICRGLLNPLLAVALHGKTNQGGGSGSRGPPSIHT
jgi:hypothetical protein